MIPSFRTLISQGNHGIKLKDFGDDLTDGIITNEDHVRGRYEHYRAGYGDRRQSRRTRTRLSGRMGFSLLTLRILRCRDAFSATVLE